MAKNTGTLIGATIRPADSADQYEVAWQNEIKGGHHTRATIAGRDAIPAYLREKGMFCTVEEDEKVYKLGNDLTTWTEFKTSGGTATLSPWQAITGLSSQLDTIQLAIEYKTDGVDASAISHIVGQFTVKTSFNGTSLTVGTIPAGNRPGAQLKRYTITQNVEHYIIIEPTGELKLVSKDEFPLPTGNDEPYSIQLFFRTGSAGTPPPDPEPVTYTATRSGNFTRNNCGANATGSTVPFSKDYTSTVSQAAANALADANFNTDGQAYANSNGTCTTNPPQNINAYINGYPNEEMMYTITATLSRPATVDVAISYQSYAYINDSQVIAPSGFILIPAGETSRTVNNGSHGGNIDQFTISITEVSPNPAGGVQIVY